MNGFFLPVCEFFVGLPGSGKSTYRKTLLAQNPDIGVLSTDDTIEKYAKELNWSYERCFNQFYKDAEEKLKRDLDQFLFEKRSFIWDQTNLTVQKRAKCFQKIRASGDKKYIIRVNVFDVPPFLCVQNCRKRTKAGGSRIDEHVVYNMANGYVVPSASEDFDILNKIRWENLVGNL